MFNDNSKIPHQEKLFLAYYGTSIPDNLTENYYKSRQKLNTLIHSQESEKQIQKIIQEQVPQILQQEIQKFFSK